jgi:hypothetical protein
MLANTMLPTKLLKKIHHPYRLLSPPESHPPHQSQILTIDWILWGVIFYSAICLYGGLRINLLLRKSKNR